MRNFEVVKRTLVLGCLLAFQYAHAADDVLQKAKRLVDQKNAKEAYALLVPYQSQRAGESAYDYLLGIAALDSGKPAEAVFALERFLATNPDNGPARLELARAYYLMGETKSSQQEFETVKRQQTPGEVNAAIQRYLSAIDQITANTGSRVRGYVEAGAGYDSNANSATANSQIAIPAFGGLIATLAPGSVRRSSQLLKAAAGIRLTHPFSAAWALNANANIGQRHYRSYGEYDIGYIDAAMGLTHSRGIDQFTGALQYQKIFLDHQSYRQTYGLLGQWQHNIDEQRQVTAYGQLMQQDYESAQQIRNANRYLVGMAYSQAFSGIYAPLAYAGAYLGRENPRRSGVPHLGNHIVGLRVGGQLTLSSSVMLTGNASHERRNYQGQEPGFMRDRSDRQTDVSLALSYAPAPLWAIKPEIIWTRNASNIALNDYSRTQYLITVRREFY